ncbi:MAG TPA: glycoside hydrolase family 20 zincin-like fold domain-containing protein [Bryobacteraceae bacterium]|nr:glycoside hydrolase family 20 zincin-like fold domain-containing protein [Bryobacteraceae bacterium]
MTCRILVLSVLISSLFLANPAAEEIPKQPGVHGRYGIVIIPEPQIVKVTEDSFQPDANTAVYQTPGGQDSSAVASLIEGVEQTRGLWLRTAGSRPDSNGIILSIVPESRLEGVPPGSARKEAYILAVTQKGVSIEAAFPQGLFYGVQTLLQLLQQGKGNIRGLRILDWPDMEFRAIHVDLWYHLDRPWYYEHLFRQLARYKINTAVFEFEDKFQYTRHPVLSAPGALTHEQVRQLVQTATKYHIEIVPLVQTLGHVSFIAKHPEFQHLREVPKSNWQLCPLKEGTFGLIREMLDELLDVVEPAKHVHIGGDEARELGMGPECRAKWGDKAPVESYKLWLTFVCDLLKKRGKTAIVWDDMFLRHFNAADMARLPDNLIYMRWDYDAGKFVDRDKLILNLKYPVWVATAAQTMTPIFPDQRLRVYNNANFIPDAVALGVKGVLNTAWEDEGIHPETYWIGFVCSAEYSWSGKKPTTQEFEAKFFPLFYGPRQTELAEAYDILSEKGFIRRESGWTREFGALALPPLPDAAFRVDTSWGQKHASLLVQAQQRLPRYERATEIIKANLARDPENRYNLEVLLLCARTMLHFTKLVLSIGEIDENLQAAMHDHQKGDDQAAINRYHRIGRIIDDLRHEKSALFDETVQVWEKSTYPKDFRHVPGGRDKFVHQIDRDFYYGNKTMDLSYIFEVEEKLPLFAYQQSLYQIIVDNVRGEHPWD